MWRFYTLYFLTTVFFIIENVTAADIQLTLSHYSIDENVTVTVENNSSEKVIIDSVYIDLEQQRYEHISQDTIQSHQSKNFHFNVNLPPLPGSYPLTATVRYFNEGQVLTLRHVAMYHFKGAAILDISCFVEDTIIEDEGAIIIRTDQPDPWDLILPEEVEIVSFSTFSNYKLFQVKTKAKEFQNKYPFFAVAEDIIEGKHYAKICEGTLGTGFRDTILAKRGKIPSNVLLIQAILFLCFTYYTIIRRKPETRFFTTLGKYTSRMFLVVILYYCLKNVDSWLDYSLTHISWKPYRYLATIIIDNFRGSNYEYFFKYFVDYYWGVCIVLSFPFLYYLDSDKPLLRDKYVSLLKSFFSIFKILGKDGLYWNGHSKLGFLTVGIKLFFIPYLTSWVINNTVHQKNLTDFFQWDLYTINGFLVALFIYIDTIIYAFGYLVEANFFKNNIKSVEPTILGWVVCIWCYPPFNVFSFRIFDFQIINIAHTYPGWVHALMTCLITFSWGIFAWASVALGFKASNLTNRGIVTSGPYRFARHPAYFAKIFIWLIQGIFFGQYFVGILMGFILIYVLRAWTEERHLSMDPDYTEYKKMVRWKFIPGVI